MLQALGDGDPQLQYQPKASFPLQLVLAQCSELTATQPIMEVNVKHPVLKKLRSLHAHNEKDALALDTANILFESSAVASGECARAGVDPEGTVLSARPAGYAISDPQSFVQRMNRVLANALGTDDDEEAPNKQEEQAKPEEPAKEEL